MYILKNALLSIRRNRGRNILIGIVMIVISCAATISLAIQSSSKTLIEGYENQYQVEATLSVNRDNMMMDLSNFDPNSEESQEEQKESLQNLFGASSSVTVDEVEKYGDSDYVKSYYYTESLKLAANDLEKASTEMSFSFGGDNSMSTGMSMPNMGGMSMPGMSNVTEEASDTFTLTGYSSLEAMEEFISGTYKITEGSVSLDVNTCLVNSELAALNGLEVGDTITFTNDDDAELKLKIVGIFEETTDSSNGMDPFSASANTMVTSTTTIEEFAKENDITVSVTPTFILTDKEVVDAFTTELTEKGLDENLTVSTNLDQVENATSTISNISRFALIFLLVVLGIGGIVLLVINMITIRERKYEIGVLRTIGMKKSKVALQFISELFIVSIISLFIGAGIGACTSVPVSNYLLETQISNSNEQMESIEQNFGGGGFGGGNMPGGFDMNSFAGAGGVVQIEEFKSIDATVNLTVLAELFVIGLLLTLVSSSAALVSIEKFKPLDILKERT